jgi:hypothetical protein
MTPAQQIQIANQITIEGSVVVAHCVPTRAVRVLMLKDHCTFRVEQLDSTTWRWRALSTHTDDTPWEAFGAALDDAFRMQVRLREKIKLAMHENNMARMKALNSTSTLTPTETIR